MISEFMGRAIPKLLQLISGDHIFWPDSHLSQLFGASLDGNRLDLHGFGPHFADISWARASSLKSTDAEMTGAQRLLVALRIFEELDCSFDSGAR